MDLGADGRAGSDRKPRAEGGPAAVQQAADPSLRFFTAGLTLAAEPARDVKGSWRVSTPQERWSRSIIISSRLDRAAKLFRERAFHRGIIPRDSCRISACASP